MYTCIQDKISIERKFRIKYKDKLFRLKKLYK